MLVSKSWLEELVDLKVSIAEVEKLLPLRTIGTKDVTEDFIELDMKGYNRADLLSMRGVAYEVAAITDSKVKFSEPEDGEYVWQENINLPRLDAEVQNPDLASLYCVVKIEGLKVSDSPTDWVKKLADCGMRSVNNIADVTNFVMLEYGQPLHAFDASKVVNERIVVRTAKTGEKLETLDGKVRDLEESDLLIADSEKALGIAGVMGGKNSEVTDSTTDILLEVAIFDPESLRKTARKLNLSSEASKRFYHGLTKRRALQALDRAIRLYQDLGGKLTAIRIQGGGVDEDKVVTITLEKINSLIGVELDEKFVEEALTRLNFKIDRIGGGTWRVFPPYWRLDIEIEEDVIEEIARLYGYEKIPAKKLEGELPAKIDQSLFELIYKIKTSLVDLGLTEVQTYSFFSTNVLRNLGFVENLNELVKVANPMSAETEYMRQNIWGNLVEVVGNNSKQGFEDIAIFEIGKIYWIKPPENEVSEKYLLSIALMNGSDNPINELYAIYKKLNEELKLGIKEKERRESEQMKSFHPNRVIQLEYKGKPIGGLAEVHQRIIDKFGVSNRVAILEIALPKIL